MHTNGSRNIQEYSLHTPLVILHFLKVLHIIPLHIQDDIPKRIAHTQIEQNQKKIERDGMIGSSTSLKHGSLTENRGVSKKKRRRGSYPIPKSLTGNECRLASV